MKDLFSPKKWWQKGQTHIRVEVFKSRRYPLAESFGEMYGFHVFYMNGITPCRIGIKRGMWGKWQYLNNYHASEIDMNKVEYIIPHLCDMFMVKEKDVRYVSTICGETL